MISELFSIIVPVFICAGIGYALAHFKKQYDSGRVGFLVMVVGTPSLIFSTLTQIEYPASGVGLISLAALGLLILSAAGGFVILKMSGLSRRGYLPSIIHPNSGNVGLPLALFAFGEEGLVMGVAFFVVISISQFTLTPVLVSGKFSLRQLASTSLIYAVAASLVFMFTDLEVPKWLLNTTRLLGSLTIPLLLITLGISLAELRIGDLKNSLLVSMVRLCLGFAIGVVLAEVLGLEGTAKGVVIMQSAMPVAVFNYLFAQQYNIEPEGVAGTVVTSTLLTFLSLPLLMWYVLDFAA